MSPAFLAEGACLASALAWSISLNFFRPPILDYGARAVNLAKCCMASVMLGLAALVAGQGPLLLAASPRSLGILALSGFLGMALGDTALFAAVQTLGVYRAFLLQSMAPVFAAAMAAAFYGERLHPQQGLGALLIFAGVVLVITLQRRQPAALLTGGWDGRGIALGLVAALGQGVGIVLSKDGMAEIPFQAASFVRLLAAALGLIVMLAFAGRLKSAVQKVGRPIALGRILGPTFLGTFLAILSMMYGIAHAPAAVAAVLLATTPVFSLFLDWKLHGVALRWGSLAGTLLAIVGVGVLAAAG